MTPEQPTDPSQDPLANGAVGSGEKFAEVSGEDLVLDKKLEAFLNESLTSLDPLSDLPSDFTSRLVASRPFAPWEARRAAFWKVPALVASFFLASSLAFFVTPLLRLGTTTALTVWFRVLVASVGRPVVALILGAPLLAQACAKLAARGSVLSIALLAGSAILSVVLLVTVRKWRGLARTTTI